MRTANKILFAIATVFVLAASPGWTEERACRPSLSNLWHCPSNQEAQPKAKPTTTERACRPSLSNGYHCPGTASVPEAAPEPKRTVHREVQPCRPSLSNGYHCPGQAAPSASTKTQLGKDQYSTEAQAAAHCPRDTVVWANTSTGVYHYAGTHWYGNTKFGAYMCEGDTVGSGVRRAKNEVPPHP